MNLRLINNNYLFICLLFFIFVSLQSGNTQNILKTKNVPNPKYIVKPQNFPVMGKWMFNEELKPADWLAMKYKGKLIQEPINVIIIDSVSQSHEEAVKRLIENCAKAGFQIHGGHSAEYRGYIGENFYTQLPSGGGKAFSDNHFNSDNNHGRIFGPYFYINKYYFTAAFSKEDFRNDEHKFDSFIAARDKFTSKMKDNAGYTIEGAFNLDNVYTNNKVFTTGDHDGIAIILHLKK